MADFKQLNGLLCKDEYARNELLRLEAEMNELEESISGAITGEVIDGAYTVNIRDMTNMLIEQHHLKVGNTLQAPSSVNPSKWVDNEGNTITFPVTGSEIGKIYDYIANGGGTNVFYEMFNVSTADYPYFIFSWARYSATFYFLTSWGEINSTSLVNCAGMKSKDFTMSGAYPKSILSEFYETVKDVITDTTLTQSTFLSVMTTKDYYLFTNIQYLYESEIRKAPCVFIEEG